ncbi:MAG: ABC-type polysaccharide/polyol phosphate transport system, ATPase component [Mycobacterium sp.]|nr:ABC-type polysaccharide/polyol phosphate transport system, ATPase component [Mycobacterium sp.]MCW2746138.1 ABC-type polysaccharide/polyol phosphate transport system, ATPase component [Mycobacterium sp.]
MTAAIELAGVGKRYVQTDQGDATLLSRVRRLGRRNHSEMWALRDLDFRVEQGETVGVIGRNGSGKTTLLRLLSGVSAPSTGRLRVVGKVAPLIGIGVGFNPELTGRENVFVNGRLLGMTDAEVRRNFDAILDFSEIEKFIDTPVKYYSSGMFLRLAFAVAVHTQPEVLVLDEVLAVGDLAFQLKCMDRMREIQRAGTTIVIVTHNLHTLDRTAPRAVLLSKGRMVYDGPTEQAIGRMHEVMQQETRERTRADLLLQEGGDAQTYVGGAEVLQDLVDAAGTRQRTFATGEELTVRIRATFEEEVRDPILGIMVAPVGLGAPAYTTHTFPGAYAGVHGPGRPLDAEVTLQVRLLGGGYTITSAVYDRDGEVMVGTTPAESFYVTSVGVHGAGLVDMAAKVEMGGKVVETPEGELERLGAPAPSPVVGLRR